MKIYRKKGTVKASIYTGSDKKINTSWGEQILHDGDYLVISNGEEYPVSKEVFENTYEEVV